MILVSVVVATRGWKPLPLGRAVTLYATPHARTPDGAAHDNSIWLLPRSSAFKLATSLGTTPLLQTCRRPPPKAGLRAMRPNGCAWFCERQRQATTRAKTADCCDIFEKMCGNVRSPVGRKAPGLHRDRFRFA